MNEKFALLEKQKTALVASYSRTPVYGNSNPSLCYQSWPSEKELSAKTNVTIQSLRLKKIEWALADDIYGIKITLSDGSSSKNYGGHCD